MHQLHFKRYGTQGLNDFLTCPSLVTCSVCTYEIEFVDRRDSEEQLFKTSSSLDPEIEANESAFWVHLASDERFLLMLEFLFLVATVFNGSGAVSCVCASVGLGKSLRYSSAKNGRR